MYKFPWFLLLLFGKIACAEIIPNITIIGKENLILKYDNPILLENNYFKIIVESSLFNKEDVIYIKCLYAKNNEGLSTPNKLSRNVEDQYVVNVTRAIYIMNNIWNCTITKNDGTADEKKLTISFPTHVRLMEMPAGVLRVNDRNIELKQADVSVTDYDAFGTYYYRDEELAKFTCQKKGIGKYNTQGFIFNISGTIHNTFTAENETNLYLKMGYKGLPKHIDCTMKKFSPPGSSNIRLNFKPSTSKIDYPQFQVNGYNLSPSGSYSEDNYTFVYEYYPGEGLDVKSNLDKRKYKSLSCNGENHIPDTADVLKMTIPTDQKDRTSVKCLVERHKERNVAVSIEFIEDLMKFSPNLIGIQWSKIIAKFNDIINNKIESTFYALSKTYDEKILHCSCDQNIMKCNYDAEVNSTILTTTTSESQYDKTPNIILNKGNVNKKSFECKYEKSTTKVVLVQQKESTQENTANGNSNTNADVKPTNEPIKNDTDNPGILPDKYFLPLIIGVTSIIIILFITTLIVCIRKRKKFPKAEVDINYENLPAHNEGSMAIPSQWNTNNSTNENFENAYAKVIPKSQRTTVAEIYSKPLSNTDNQCYASPYNASLESPYAEIVINSEGNVNILKEPANVGKNYGQIVPKVLKNVAQNKVLPTNDEDGTKIRNRSNTDKQKYANVFNGDVYANVSSSGL